MRWFETGDVSDEGLMRALVARAVEESGRLHYLVNAAGALWFDRDTSTPAIRPALARNLLPATRRLSVVGPSAHRGVARQ